MTPVDDPATSQTLAAPGLHAPVEIAFDQWDIPFITATDGHDAAYAMGWLHAANRMFMMEFLRRAATGRLAELIGVAGLKTDRLMRTFGFEAAAAAEYAAMPEAVGDQLRGYAAGVSAWIEAHPRTGRGAELRLLRARLNPWTPADCLLAARLFALGLCGNWESELTRAEVLARYGADVLAAYDLEGAPHRAASLLSPDALSAMREASSEGQNVLGTDSPGAGSNAWAVAPSRTNTGGAVLAGDTHIDLSLPCTWFEAGVRYGDVSVRGCTLPGSPGVIIGTNGHVAWTLVNSTADVQDLAVEHIDEATDTYLDGDGTWAPLEVRDERIAVRWGRARVHRVRSTPRGPLLTDVVEHHIDEEVATPEEGSAQHLSLRWPVGMEPGTLAHCVHELSRARNADDVRVASRLWTAPSQQIVYADSAGSIGRMIVGRIPVRADSDGSLPLDANDPAAAWVRDLTEEELPSEHDPESGFVIGANEAFESRTGAFVSREWCNPYRAMRVREVLSTLRSSGLDDHARLQLDTVAVAGREFQALVAARTITPQSPAGERALQALTTWNCDLSADSAGGAVYGLVIAHLQQALWAPLNDLAPAMLGAKRGPAGGSFPHMYAVGIPRVLHDLRADDTTLMDLNPVLPDTWDELIADAMDIAGTALDDACGDRSWAWGEIHRIRIAHGLGFIPGVHGLLSRGPWPSGGDFDTVWQAGHAPKIHNDSAVVGPAQRMIIDLADPDRSRAVLCGGQSGHSVSPHYDDQLELWRRGQLRPMPITPAAVARLAVRHERLIPA